MGIEPVVIEATLFDDRKVYEMGATLEIALSDIDHGCPIDPHDLKPGRDSIRQISLEEARALFGSVYDRAYTCVTNPLQQKVYFMGSPERL